jgi:transcription elongation factor GreA
MSAVPDELDDDVLVTAAGHAQLRAELELLRDVRRVDLAEQLREVRDDHDPDSSMLFELLEEQAQLDERISALEARLAAARIVEPSADGTAGIGSRVSVRVAGGDVAEYDLVGAIESDVGNGRVSVAAPVGRALHGRRAGDAVEATTPRGVLRLEILNVRAIEQEIAPEAA